MIAMLMCALVYAAVLSRLLPLRDAGARWLLVAAVLGLSLVPYPWGPVAWLRSYTGEFSITAVLLATVALLAHTSGQSWLTRRELRGFCLAVVLVAVWFYPMSLGATYLNPYEWGFGSYGLSSALLLAGLLAWLLRAWFCLAALVLAQFAYAAGLLPSDNLWDYLLDIWLAFWALGWLIRDGLRLWRERPSVQASSASE